MSKRARHQPGFYTSLFDDFHDRGLSYKYRPKQKLVVVGTYEVERIVSKPNQGGNVVYFGIQWKNYSSNENTWGPSEHLSEDLIAAFEKRPVDPVRIDECRDRLPLLFEKGLRVMLVLFVNTSISMVNRGGKCPVVYRGGAMSTLNSSGNFQRGRYKSRTGSTRIADLNKNSFLSRTWHITIGAILIQISDPS